MQCPGKTWFPQFVHWYLDMLMLILYIRFISTLLPKSYCIISCFSQQSALQSMHCSSTNWALTCNPPENETLHEIMISHFPSRVTWSIFCVGRSDTWSVREVSASIIPSTTLLLTPRLGRTITMSDRVLNIFRLGQKKHNLVFDILTWNMRYDRYVK